MITTKFTENELLEFGFIKKPCILHPTRLSKEDEFYIGQIDENGSQKDMFVYTLPRGFRFYKHIVVNYRNELFLYTSGFTHGGIEVYKTLTESDFYFRETDEWKEEVKSILDKLCDMEGGKE